MSRQQKKGENPLTETMLAKLISNRSNGENFIVWWSSWSEKFSIEAWNANEERPLLSRWARNFILLVCEIEQKASK